jgi:hypothetical protein
MVQLEELSLKLCMKRRMAGIRKGLIPAYGDREMATSFNASRWGRSVASQRGDSGQAEGDWEKVLDSAYEFERPKL